MSLQYGKKIRQEVSTNRKPEINKSNKEKRSNDEIEDNAVDINSTPTMVFSVIGDSERFAGRSWPTTIFQKALIEAAKCGGGRILYIYFFVKRIELKLSWQIRCNQ